MIERNSKKWTQREYIHKLYPTILKHIRMRMFTPPRAEGEQ